MYKIIITAKRKPGTSLQEFQDYYENKHAVLGMKLAAVKMRKYVRNYLTPISPATEAPYDCVTECWFESERDFQRAAESMATDKEKAEQIAKDEENLFDRATIRWFAVTERESTIL